MQQKLERQQRNISPQIHECTHESHQFYETPHSESFRDHKKNLNGCLGCKDDSETLVSGSKDLQMGEVEDSGVHGLRKGLSEFGLQSKRRKRPHSPGDINDRSPCELVRSTLPDRRDYLQALDLVFQFHG
ncbi:hypothetical protein AMTRI_Chr09g37380 [Amborella trichopoda]|uniref:Uncharacterized protein n=1 Tax=Amborella trichopoda TaxID=13333 RepID=W1PKF6_AMBTC|nr:hypothetical protein AMTR_s00018p00108070 [Amborella trichopoda]